MSFKRYAIGASTTTVEVGVASNDCIAEWVVQLTGTIGSGTVAFKGYARGNPTPGRSGADAATALSASDAVGLPYYGQAGTVVTGATAASALGIYRVICPAGVSLVLDYTAAGGSDLVAHCRPAFGAAQ